MEVRYCFLKLTRKIGQHSLKLTKFQSNKIRRFRSYRIKSERAFNKYTCTPVSFSIKTISLAVVSNSETENFPVKILFAGSFKFLTDMSCHTFYIILQQVNILEYIMVNTLKNKVRSSLLSCNKISLIDKSCC